MNIQRIKDIIRREYNLDKRIKIKDINFEKGTFKMKFGLDYLYIRLPKILMREYKLEMILSEKKTNE
jgi:hypothetical protein